MATVPNFENELNLREQIARIDRTQAEASKMTAEVAQIKFNTKLEPWRVGLSGVVAGGALVTAVIALLEVFRG